ncbi:MAG: ATP-binding protein, partial [Thermomicrobiales bacterium]
MELLERTPYLRELDGLLREAAAGRGRLVLLGGEAGVGKTSLVRRFASEAHPTARVLAGACDPLSTPRPLGPLLDIAAAVGGDLGRLAG